MLFRSLRYNWPLQVDSPLPAVPFQTTHPSQCAKIISAHYWFNHDKALGLQWLTVTWRIEAKLLYRAQRPATILTPLQLCLLTICPNQILLSGFTKLLEAPYSALVFKLPLLSNPYSWVLYALTIPLCSQQRHLLLLPISGRAFHSLFCSVNHTDTGFHHSTQNFIFLRFYLPALLSSSRLYPTAKHQLSRCSVSICWLALKWWIMFLFHEDGRCGEDKGYRKKKNIIKVGNEKKGEVMV